MKIEIDKFNLMYWAEGVSIGSHLRQDFWDRCVSEFYRKLSKDERLWFYTYAKRDISSRYLDPNRPGSKEFFQFLACYNPGNRFMVSMEYAAKNVKPIRDIVEAYRWQGEYYVDFNRMCHKPFIKSVEPVPFENKCDAAYCMWHDSCARFDPEADEQHVLYANTKCDWFINKNTEHGADLSHFEL